MSLAGRQIVFLASIDWSAPWQRHQAFASEFARRGHEVFFVENTGFRGLRWADAGRVLRRLKNMAARADGGAAMASRGAAAPAGSSPAAVRSGAGIRVLSPAVLPPTNDDFRRLNRSVLIPRLIRKLRAAGLRDRPVVFAYLPTATTIELLDALEPVLTVYDCAAHFAGHPDRPADLENSESALLARADRVLTDSHFLFERQSRRHARVLEAHHGVSEAFFRSEPEAAPKSYRRFCYFGTLWSAIDYEPIRALADAGFEADLIGPVKEAPPPLPEAVKLLGPVPPPRLPEAVAGYDAFLLPYRMTSFSQGVIPAKTYECLATGKPVLCSPLPELARFAEYFYLCAAPEDWPKTARRLAEMETAELRRARVDLARKHSTPVEFDRLYRYLGETP